MKFVIIISMILFSMVIQASASPVILEDGKDFYLIGLNLDILEDPTKKLTINDITEPKWSKEFKRSKSASPNLGTANSAFWARFKVKNNSSRKAWIFSDKFQTQDKIEFYQKKGKGWSKIVTGDAFPFKTRSIKTTPFNFTINPSFETEYYLRVEGFSKQLPLTISTSENFIEELSYKKIGHGLFFGIAITLIFYNALLFFSSRKLTYLYYVGYTFISTLAVSAIIGTGQQHLWPNQPWFNNKGLIFLKAFSYLFMIFFFNKALRLKLESTRLFKITIRGLNL